MPDLFNREIKYVCTAHRSINQRRQYTNEPYENHCIAVAELVWIATQDVDTTIAALGHDLEEDVTPINPLYTRKHIQDNLGEHAESIIYEVSNVYVKEAFPNLNREERKALEYTRLSSISIEAKNVKLPDISHNCCDLTIVCPVFARVYIPEKVKVMGILRDANPILYNNAFNILATELFRLKTIHQHLDR